VNSFLTLGKQKNLYCKSVKLAVHKHGYIFPVYKFLKLYVNIESVAEFIALLRPVAGSGGPQPNYILLNNLWEIDSMSNELHMAMNLKPKIYQKKQSNLLASFMVLAP